MSRPADAHVILDHHSRSALVTLRDCMRPTDLAFFSFSLGWGRPDGVEVVGAWSSTAETAMKSGHEVQPPIDQKREGSARFIVAWVQGRGRSLIQSLLRSPAGRVHEAEEQIISNVVFRYVRASEQKEIKEPEKYAATIVRNQVKNYWRGKARRPKHESITEVTVGIKDLTDACDIATLRAELDALVIEMTESLPSAAARVVAMLVRCGWDEHRTARALLQEENVIEPKEEQIAAARRRVAHARDRFFREQVRPEFTEGRAPSHWLAWLPAVAGVGGMSLMSICQRAGASTSLVPNDVPAAPSIAHKYAPSRRLEVVGALITSCLWSGALKATSVGAYANEGEKFRHKSFPLYRLWIRYARIDGDGSQTGTGAEQLVMCIINGGGRRHPPHDVLEAIAEAMAVFRAQTSLERVEVRLNLLSTLFHMMTIQLPGHERSDFLAAHELVQSVASELLERLQRIPKARR